MSDLADLVGSAVLEAEVEQTSKSLSEAEFLLLDALLQRLALSKKQIIKQANKQSTDQSSEDESVSQAKKSIRKSIVDIARSLDSSQLSLLGINRTEFQARQSNKRDQSVKQSKKSMQKAADAKHINSVNLRNARNAALQAMLETHAMGAINNDQLLLEQSNQAMIEQSTEQAVDQSSSQPMLTDEAATTNHSSYHVRTIITSNDQSDSQVVVASNRSTNQPINQLTNQSTDQSTIQATDINKLNTKLRKMKIDQAGQFSDPPQSTVTIEDESQLEQPSSHSNSQSTDQSANHSSIQPVEEDEFGPELSFPRSCYSCKTRFFRLHRFYDQFCGDCARLNWTKRKQLANLNDWVVLLTGCRVKIGYCVGLRVLRSGGTLIGTSRFPVDTVRRYLAEKDSDNWKHRLHIYGLDLRDLQATHQFCEMVMQKHPRIDALINNAAQTVRRPVAYYLHLMPIESINRTSMPDEWKNIVQFDDSHTSRIAAIQAKNQSADRIQSEDQSNTQLNNPADEQSQNGTQSVVSNTQFPHSTSALLSQLALTTEDQQSMQSNQFFPQGKFDVTGQQLDLRPINSWILTLDQVSPIELVEVFAINALSPFILCAGLRKALANRDVRNKSANIPHYSHIVNVSAMEGKFYRHKSPFHPHTNMAKAALNMMTRTSAQDYAQQRIWMNAADTGWINDENTFEKAKEIREQNNFQTPIDEEDAAARILDPIMQSAIHGVHHYGKFFKDYRETEW